MRVVALLSALTVAALAAPPAATGAGDWPWPVEGEVVTRYRNGDDPYAAGMHRGIDIAAPVGARVVAAAAGRVTWAGIAGSSGLTVAIDTGALTTTYLHLSAASVDRGARVAAGETIGAVGTSGTRSAAQPHLHFGVRESGTDHAYRDPLEYLRPVAAPAPPERPPAPAPARAPEPAAPLPAPAPVPITAPSPLPRPVPVRVPERVPRGAAPRPMPAPRSVPAARPTPAAPRARPRPGPSVARAPKQLPRASSGPAGRTTHASPPASEPKQRAPHRPGPVSRWPLLVAAAGLLVAASSIGRAWPSTSRRPSTTPTASRISVMRTRPSRPM